MDIIPEFKIGLYNAWILTAPLILSGWIYLKCVSYEKAKRLVDRDWCTPRELKIATFLLILIYSTVFYSIGVPLLEITNIWFIVGIIVYLFGLIFMIVSYFNYQATPLNKPIVKGVYKISRNPMYFFATVGYFGASIASRSLTMFILVIVFSIVQHIHIKNEERYCINEYGKKYTDYMKKVPRYFFFF